MTAEQAACDYLLNYLSSQINFAVFITALTVIGSFLLTKVLPSFLTGWWQTKRFRDITDRLLNKTAKEEWCSETVKLVDRVERELYPPEDSQEQLEEIEEEIEALEVQLHDPSVDIREDIEDLLGEIISEYRHHDGDPNDAMDTRANIFKMVYKLSNQIRDVVRDAN
jgi:hypothetical protein